MSSTDRSDSSRVAKTIAMRWMFICRSHGWSENLYPANDGATTRAEHCLGYLHDKRLDLGVIGHSAYPHSSVGVPYLTIFCGSKAGDLRQVIFAVAGECRQPVIQRHLTDRGMHCRSLWPSCRGVRL